jgi:hypothetical protein
VSENGFNGDALVAEPTYRRVQLGWVE